jgi:galactonate dehydratase
VHDKLGTRVSFGIDFHGRVSAAMAKPLLRELEPYRPLFVEEPVLPEQAEHYPRLAASTTIPLAAGERMYSRYEFKRVLAEGGIAILQPDLSHAGGITECYKIAAMAEAYDVALAPHCPLGPVALASCLQVDFVAYNAMLQEQSMGIHYNRGAELLDYVVNKDDFRIEAGYIHALPKPGLGVEIDEERVLHASRHAPDWHNPVWRHADGSVAEW